ncbi:MAG: hypothetical protein R2860_03890 [Desulfobacterales bacterium]
MGGPTNITDIFEKHEINKAIEKVITDTNINFDAHGLRRDADPVPTGTISTC